MKLYEIERMSPMQRRRFLKVLGTFLGAAGASPAMRFACNEVAGGLAHAQSSAALPVYFLELNLRDQWDHGHFFVAPGLASHSGLRRGAEGRKAALYYGSDELLKKTVNGTDVYLTNDSKILEPHLDTIAMVDTFELGQGDIHGHEAANPLRSPGKSKQQGPGMRAMFDNDPIDNFPQGCEAYYSSTPTPASLHNYYQKTLNPSLRNGVAFKGIGRGLHTVYHFGAGLSGAELDRKYSVDALVQTFPSRLEDVNILKTPGEADALERLLTKVDQRFLQKRRFGREALDTHAKNLADSRKLFHGGAPRLISLPLTEEERAFWSEGVPDHYTERSKANIWEQMAYAFKILSNDLTRTVALEFDYIDEHNPREESLLRTEAKQAAIPLARMIAKLKEAGIYDRTLIAVYTTDGSRTPEAQSTGDRGKNTLILAGGMVRGGYFGDLRVAGDMETGHSYSYHAPDPVTGAPGPGSTDNDRRASAAAGWRTVVKALGIPDSVAEQFPSVANARPLPFLLRT